MQTQELAKSKLIKMLQDMVLIRHFEDRVRTLFAEGRLPGFIHLSTGEEAIPVGVCANLRDDDFITSTHRGHHHCIAKGVDPRIMMAELFGKGTGASRGKGGSMHIFDNKLGMLGANGIVGAGAPLATGAALSAKMRGTDQVAVCFFGNGSANQGAVHESMNLAAVWRLPVIFVNENNRYAQFTREDQEVAVLDLSKRAAGYGMPGVTVDGMDVMAVHDTAQEAVKTARAGEGPSFIECKTYRFYGHMEGDPQVYRSQDEVKEMRKRDPIMNFKANLIHDGVLTDAVYSTIEGEAERKVLEAVKFAEESPPPSPSEYMDDVYVSYP